MNKIKTLLLGTAALTVAATGAQAADPIFDVKAPREPVYRCDITGFIELPGTDICFKVGGYARLVATAGSKYFAGTAAAINPGATRGVATPALGITFPLLSYGNFDNGFTMYGQGRINFDAITATEYGTVRAFIEMQASDDGTNSGGAFGLRHAFVQFGNWTFGKTWSTFYPGFSVGNYADAYTTTGDNFLRTTQIRYTQAFGGGFTLSLAIENPGYGEDAPAVGAGPLAPFGPPVAIIDDRDELPVFVAALGASGAWGQAQLAGLVLRNETRDWSPLLVPGGGAFAPGATDSEIGWGASFGLALNVPTGAGDVFLFNATYTDGASQYHSSSFAGVSGVSTVWGNTAGVATPWNNSILDTVTAWSVSAAYQHFWTPTVNTSIGAGYSSTELPGTFLVAAAATDAEVDSWDAWANVEWTPVNNLSFLLEGRYASVDFNGVDVDGLAFNGINDNEDAFSVTFQATRSF